MLEWESMTQAEKYAAKMLAENDPLTFMRVWFQITQGEKLKINWHHRLFNKVAIQLLNKEIQNVIINVAPGSTKTEFWSIHLPAYCFANYEKVRILNTSFSKDLVTENSERTRSLVKSAEWQELYGHEIGKDKVDDWTINNDSGKRTHQLFSRSSGGQITGVRGGYMTGARFSGYVSMDDWQKPDDMFSQVKRDRSNQRASNTVRSRRGDYRTPISSIQQRLHANDLTDFLLNGGLGMEFEHVKVPALINQEYIDSLPDDIREHCINDVCHTDQIDGYWSFFPAKESVHDLIALRESDPYTFASQYMQEPESLSGGIFKADNFKFYSDNPEDGEDVLPVPFKFEYRFITADTAQKTKTYNDYSVFAEWGVFENRVYRLSFFRGKLEAPALKQQFKSFVANAHYSNSDTRKGNLRAVLIEDKSSGTGLIQELSKSSPVPFTPIQRSIDKLTRAMDGQPHHHQGRVVLPYGDKDNAVTISEVCSFTENDTHANDDITDVMLDAIDYALIQPKTKPSATMLIPSKSRRR